MYYIWAIPTTIILYSMYAYLCKQNDNGSIKDFLLVWLFGCLFTQPLWSLVSRVSHRLTFDGLLFNTLIVLSYTFTMIVLNKTVLGLINYIGISLIFSGLILTKV